MKLTHDRRAQAAYLRFRRKKVAQTIRVSETVHCDLDEQGELCGIELLNVSAQDVQRISHHLKVSLD